MLQHVPAPRARLRAGRVSAALIATAALLALGAGNAAAACSALPCAELVAPLPYELDFGSNHGGVPDRHGVGTGFTYVDPPQTGGGFEPGRLLTGDGTLRITTGPGIAYRADNTLENGLAVGVPAAARVFSVETTIDRPPRGSGRYEQGGLWLGTGQDNYLKLVVISQGGRIGVQLLGEADERSALSSPGGPFARRFVNVPALDKKRVTLVMRGDAQAGTVAAFYAVDDGDLEYVATFEPPPTLLTGGAVVDPVLAGGRLAGVFATHRRGLGPVEYRFERFEVACHNDGCPRSRPDPGPGGRGGRANKRNPRDDDARRIRTTSGTSGSLRATLRHARRVRGTRLVARGLPVVLRCSERCAMRARLHGARRWARAVGIVATSRIAVGGGQVRMRGTGVARTRLRVFPRMRGRFQRSLPRRVAIEATVRSPSGRRVRLRSFVTIQPRTRSRPRG
jgi:hypothetical protein